MLSEFKARLQVVVGTEQMTPNDHGVEVVLITTDGRRQPWVWHPRPLFDNVDGLGRRILDPRCIWTLHTEHDDACVVVYAVIER